MFIWLWLSNIGHIIRLSFKSTGAKDEEIRMLKARLATDYNYYINIGDYYICRSRNLKNDRRRFPQRSKADIWL